jgi:protein involved in polysaccharide export with SLBB domain
MRLKGAWLAFLLIVGTSGCAVVKKPTRPEALPPAQAAPEAGWEYKLQIGDEADVKFFFNPNLNEHVVVRPDGRISLQLVGEIVAAGLTPRELTSQLKQEYSHELSNPELTVIVRTFSAQRVFVGGEVAKPGEFQLVGSLTVLQAVAMAQGFKDTARLAEVIVIRHNVDRTPLAIPVNVKHAINGTDLSQNMALMPYDVVYVPRSTIANVNKWMDEYIRKNIPVNFAFRYDLTPSPSLRNDSTVP